MKLRIVWTNNGFIQFRTLVNYCVSDKTKQSYITMNSPIYKAIEDGSFILDTSYGKHPFTVEFIES